MLRLTRFGTAITTSWQVISRPAIGRTSRIRFIATALGMGSTRGIDWIELIIQGAQAAAGVALVAGRYAPGRRL